MPRVLVVQHEPSTGPGFFGTWLPEAGVELEVCHPYLGDPLPSLSSYDGLLVLGGAMGPSDDGACPWLPGTRELLALAVAQRLPTFGICLGAELLVLACGGSVRRGVQGPELGVLPIRLEPGAADDPVFAAVADGTRVLQWHWEEMSELPAGAELLATSAAYRHQVFRVGSAAWGVQGHPEVTGDIADAWAGEDTGLLATEGIAPDDLVAQVRDAEAGLAAAWAPVARGFAAVVAAHAAGQVATGGRR